MVITKEQRKALKRIYDRGPIFEGTLPAENMLAEANGWRFVPAIQIAASYRLPSDTRIGDYVWVSPHSDNVYQDATDLVRFEKLAIPLTYRQFRKTVQQGFDCLMVNWKGMWLGIEKDGYVHS